MTYSEIIEKLKQSELSFKSFTHEDIPYGEFSEKALKAQEIRDEWVKNNPNPGYGTKEYNEWHKQLQELSSKYDISRQEWKQKEGLDWIEVDQYGGEGQGDTWYSIKHFPNDNIYIRIDGYYQSYDGVSFDGGYDECCTQVKPVEKTITVYE